MGVGFVWNPVRWRTRDGYVPYRVLISASRGFPALWAFDRLQMTKAVNTAQGGKEAQNAHQADYRLAKGEE